MSRSWIVAASCATVGSLFAATANAGQVVQDSALRDSLQQALIALALSRKGQGDPDGMNQAFAELLRHDFVVRAGRNEAQRMNTTSLPNTVDTTDPLFHAERRPWKFKIDDETTAVVEVQSLAGGIGCQQQRSLARVEPSNHFGAFTRRQAAVQ